MFEWFKNLDTRDILAVFIVVGFLIGVFSLPVDKAGSLEEMAQLVLAFYFINKATKDRMS